MGISLVIWPETLESAVVFASYNYWPEVGQVGAFVVRLGRSLRSRTATPDTTRDYIPYRMRFSSSYDHVRYLSFVNRLPSLLQAELKLLLDYV